jgi:hypothetical protein
MHANGRRISLQTGCRDDKIHYQGIYLQKAGGEARTGLRGEDTKRRECGTDTVKERLVGTNVRVGREGKKRLRKRGRRG